MNLLITNTRNAQAYAIIRALRPHAEKIVATMEGNDPLAARLSHAANSRLVDKRFYTPSPERDWRAGRVQKENSEGEEAYIQAVLEICKKEKIDTIFPSFDPHVYVFSKNKERFQQREILIPVPDYEIVINLLDKYRIIRAAEASGFPCPKTYLPESENEVRQIAVRLGFPLIIKPRFSAGGRGTAVVRDIKELTAKIGPVIKNQGMPLLQEYIPGNLGEYIHLVVDKEGQLKLAFHKQFQRYLCKSALSVYRESIPANRYAELSGMLLKKLGWWGGALGETRTDSRDNIQKLMEVNPRFGSGLLEITEAGINMPWMCLKIARGKPVDAIHDYATAVIVHPVDDMLVFGLRLLDMLIYRFRYVLRGQASLTSPDTPRSLRELIQPYRYAYFSGKRKFVDPSVKLLFRDPVVTIILWSQRVASVLAAASEIVGTIFKILPVEQPYDRAGRVAKAYPRPPLD